ncbi:MAG TPA: FlgD immunoglobulin-like domain containing protein, partial [Candidatus Eisenbacteria bacterium]|nr:FlgD immunoglobulin-like domain containing protein [Candidatus Eisenbacteria bacterium]
GMAMHAGRPHELFVSARDGVHVSINEGATWSKMNDGLSAAGLLVQNISFDADDPNRLYIGTINSGVWARDLEPVSVRLTHMEAVRQGDDIVLRWGVADAVDHAGFHVDREAVGHRERLTPALLSGQDEFVFVDASPVSGALNRYWIVELSRTGEETRYGPLDVQVHEVIAFRVGAAAPNPFRAETRLALSGGVGGVVARVFDASGRRVASLAMADGQDAIVWNARDDRGRRMPAGFYVIQAEAGALKIARRVLLLP